jgi:hypothetical protein
MHACTHENKFPCMYRKCSAKHLSKNDQLELRPWIYCSLTHCRDENNFLKAPGSMSPTDHYFARQSLGFGLTPLKSLWSVLTLILSCQLSHWSDIWCFWLANVRWQTAIFIPALLHEVWLIQSSKGTTGRVLNLCPVRVYQLTATLESAINYGDMASSGQVKQVWSVDSQSRTWRRQMLSCEICMNTQWELSEVENTTSSLQSLYCVVWAN